MKNKKQLIIIICTVICTLILGNFIYIKYNNKTNSNDDSDLNIKKESITLNDKNDYFEEENKDLEKDSISNQDDINSNDVSSYIDTVVDSAINETNNNENESKLKNTFITLTDFIFYEGTIKGYTFKELREEQKQKILSSWEKLDAKIETKYPNYKENIKEKSNNTYTNIKEKLNSLKDSLSTIIQDKVDDEVIEEAKTDTDNLKDVTSVYKEKTIDYYNTAKEKVTDWYNKYKNNK